MTVHRKLLEVLVCPACKGPLSEVLREDGPLAATDAARAVVALDCRPCRLRYPIIDDIPVMLVDQAQRIPA